MPTIDNLVLEIESNSADAERGLGSLAKALAGLRTAASNQRSLNVVAKGVRAISNASNSLTATGVKSLNDMTNALRNIGALKDIKLSSSFASQIKGIGDAVRTLDGVNWSSIKDLSDNLAPLSAVQKATNLNNVVNTLKKLPDALDGVNKLDSKKISEFADKVEQLRISVKPLADEMRAVSAGLSSLPKNIQKAIKANAKLTESNKKTKKSFGSLVKNIFSVGAAFYVLQRGVDTMMNLFEKSNQYEEVLNMTAVSLGKNADAAIRYADQVERLAGINQVEWLTNVGTLNQMFQGFGVGADAAAHMSQQLTQLAYDIQSVYNVSDMQEVMRRLQSGITGEVEGMRRYGVELSNASMQEFLLARGINVKVSALNMAQKSAVRYNMIMTKTGAIQGDLARTIINPANSLRILQNQIQIAGRYLGQLVSVIAARVIPWIQALVKVIGSAAQALASLWGYALPNISGGSNSITGSLGNIADSVDKVGGSAGAAKDELKGLLASFDEINIIQQEQSSGGGGGGGASALEGLGGLDWLTDYGYDFLNGINSQVDNLVEKIKGFLPIIGTVAAALAGWKIADEVADFFGSTNPMWGLFAATQIINIALVWDAVSDMFENGLTPKNVIEWISGALVGSVGGWALTKDPIHGLRLGFGMSLMATAVRTMKESFTTTDDGKSIGLAIVSALEAGVSIALLTGSLTAGLVATPVIAIAAIVTKAYIDNKNEAKEKLKSAFGDINLSSEEVTEMVALLTAGAVADIQLAVSGWKDIEATKSSIEQMLTGLETDMRGLQIGVDTSPEMVQAIADSVTQITADAKKLLNQQSIAGSFTLDLLFGKGSEESKSMTATGTQIRSAYSDYVEGLAGEFNSYLSEAINDGELTVDEQTKAMEIYSSWKNAIDIARGMARQDNLNKVSIDLALSGNLSKESVDAAAEQIRAEKDAAWHDVTYSLAQEETQLQVDVNMAYELYSSDPTLENLNQWEDAKNRLEVWNENLPNIVAEKKVEFDLEWEAIEWAIYEPAIKKYSEDIFNATQSGISENWGSEAILLDPKLALDSGSTAESVRKIAEEQVSYYRDGFVKELSKQNVDTESVGKIFAGQMQSIAKNQKIIKEAREAGQIPAKEYIEAYKNQMKLGAMAGDKSAIDYVTGSLMIGQSGFFDLINTVKGAGADYAGAFGQGFIDSLNITKNEAGKWFVDFGNGMVLDINNLSPTLAENLKLMGVDLSNAAKLVSQDIDSALEISGDPAREAIVDSATDMKSQMKAETPGLEGAATTMANAIKQKMIISPTVDTSGATKKLGEWGENITRSLEGLNPVVKVKVAYSSVTEAVKSTAQKVADFAASLKKGTSGVKSVSVSGFASGGFPTEGQLFLAREAGPELVGQMGGRTAVANNAQIVDGITAGVSQANSEQNALLREQNALLRSILAKDSSVSISPSAALGRVVRQSEQLYSRASGNA